MNFHEVRHSDAIIGYSAEAQNALFFFGTKLCTQDLLVNHYSKFKFYRVKQVHQDRAVPVSESLLEADAHWATNLFQAPIIETADCLPILISHPNFVAAVHAGWRGVLNQITTKTITQLISQFGHSDKLCVTVGPHILVDSFEVDIDLAIKFKDLYAALGGTDSTSAQSPINSKKSYINLHKILALQLRSIGISSAQIHGFIHDTKTDLRFASYRRQNLNPGRNLSFVSRLKI